MNALASCRHKALSFFGRSRTRGDVLRSMTSPGRAPSARPDAAVRSASCGWIPPTTQLSIRIVRCLLMAAILILLSAHQAGATQVHASPEGLYTHQIAHGFFAASMAILIFWLRHRGLVRERGWRMIQFAAFFFILWNLDAMVAHYLDDRSDLFQVIDEGTWHARIGSTHGLDAVTVAYYLVKFDHVLCVPAIVLLYIGLHRLLQQAQGPAKPGQPA
jgi:hypothetical protein